MLDTIFSWMPIYRELAEKLLGWRDRQPKLIEILKEAEAAGCPIGNLNDQDEKGRRFPLKVIDPFTFYATFNRRIRDDNRIGILRVVKERIGLASPLPTDFKGLPIMHPQKSWFFSFEKDREKDAIDTLWDFAEAIVKQQPKALPPDLFGRCLGIRMVGVANLTMGMFWMRPDSYVAIDSVNLAYLKLNGIEEDVEDWAGYLDLRKQVEARMPGLTWPELSSRAWASKASNSEVGHWLFQATPDRYDLIGALHRGVLRTWRVRQHGRDIHPGDRVVLWLAGKDAGVYALATVETEV